MNYKGACIPPITNVHVYRSSTLPRYQVKIIIYILQQSSHCNEQGEKSINLFLELNGKNDVAYSFARIEIEALVAYLVDLGRIPLTNSFSLSFYHTSVK